VLYLAYFCYTTEDPFQFSVLGTTMLSISTNITIAAPPSAVRRVFLDFASYPQWNPFMTSVEIPDPAAPPGTPFELHAWKILIDRTIVVQNDSSAFAWVGGAAGLTHCMPFFQGHHHFKFEPFGDEVAEGETRECKFVQSEEYSGIFAIFSFLYGPLLKIGFNQMNRALKVRVETLAAAGGDS
jgi:hypothetical protein